jgi:orotate phosphoribosyltransferase
VGNAAELRSQLVTILRAKAVRRLPDPVQLASGQMSSDFVDGKEGLASWRDLALAGHAIAATFAEAGISFNAVGGLTLGADALSIAVAAAADCNWFFVRKEAKGRGTGRQIEGTQLNTSHRVLLVDDAVTSGGSILQAHEVVVPSGAAIVGASTLIDRSDAAAGKFAALGVPYFPMATYGDLGIDPVIFGS